jgi:FkbM family methyltransferase
MLFLRSDKFIGRSLDFYGEYCEGESELFAQILSPGQVVVEIGANIGPHTLHLAHLVGSQGLVFTFEPQRVIFQILSANIALNEAFHVRAYHAACGDVVGHLKVPHINYDADGSNFGGVSLLDVSDGEEVPLVALDTFDLPSLRLLKIDVEGMERAVIAGARQQILRHRPVLYLENDRRDQSSALIAAIEALGYDLWWHNPMLFNPENYNGESENIFGRTASFNIVCLPREQDHNVIGFRKVMGPQDWWEPAPA